MENSHLEKNKIGAFRRFSSYDPNHINKKRKEKERPNVKPSTLNSKNSSSNTEPLQLTFNMVQLTFNMYNLDKRFISTTSIQLLFVSLDL